MEQEIFVLDPKYGPVADKLVPFKTQWKDFSRLFLASSPLSCVVFGRFLTNRSFAWAPFFLF